MMWEGLMAFPFVLETKMLLLEHQPAGVRERALALFAGKAQRAVGVRGEVCIFITSSSDLRDMNRRFRGKDEATDILTFRLAPNRLKSAGDLAISAEIADENAAELGHSTETELRILILHGLLHLAGYDHETDNGEMRAREAELRQLLKLPTGLIERATSHSQRRPAAKLTRDLR
jgi:probable rRNA maturation factor